MNLHVLEHVPFERPGVVEDWAWERGCRVTRTRFYLGEALPDPDDVDFLVVMGGPMSVHDESRFPWLREEKRFLDALLDTPTPVLGICLGSQLLAGVLGAEVKPAPEPEIGWFPIETVPDRPDDSPWGRAPNRMTVLQWHGEVFDVPDGAVVLARCEEDRPQAFAWNDRVVGLQFHLEVTAGDVERFLFNASGSLFHGDRGRVQSPAKIREGTDHLPAMHARLRSLMGRLSEPILGQKEGGEGSA